MNPKTWLKLLQRRILRGILQKIPVHPSAHGFIRGRSIKTFAAPHTGQPVLLRMDVRNYFPSLSRARVQAFFRTAGYPEPVADLLGGICTNRVPRGVFQQLHEDDRNELRDLYRRAHVPQGAPTSPLLASLLTYRIDCRLHGLAAASGGVYSRYADDLAFSGGDRLRRGIERFSTHVAAILLEEGFAAQHRKTRIMPQGARQSLAGLVANRHVNIRRAEYDHLKAILTNCARLGPQEQNREGHPDFFAHLRGRVSFVEMIHPAKGKRLRTIFNQIRRH